VSVVEPSFLKEKIKRLDMVTRLLASSAEGFLLRTSKPESIEERF